MKDRFLKNVVWLVPLFAIAVLVTVFPYFKHGLAGYYSDLMYHLLRVEGVKDSLTHGIYPARIYEMFFNGSGYGSPMFYPDIFLILPACIRLLGFSPQASIKLFMTLVCGLVILSTYCSFRYIVKDRRLAVAGTFLLCLSQFYLADLQDRVGLSEYMAYIFIPIIFAAIYDYFVYEGKKTYLFGIGFVGLILSHTIMTFICGLFTILFFVIMLFVKKYRRVMFEKRIIGLVTSGVVSVACISFYIFPMIEQMMSAKYRYTTPWMHVGDALHSFEWLFRVTGYFECFAYVGVGVPFLLAVFWFGKDIICSKDDMVFTKTFFLLGIGILLGMTGLFPWRLFNNTIINMIQFSYRLYPIGLCCLTLGLIMHLNNPKYTETRKKWFFVGVVVVASVFGIVQNKTIVPSEESCIISEEYLYANSVCVGMGEWLPVDFDSNFVTSEEAHKDFYRLDYLKYQLMVQDSMEKEYQVPLIYYKGYKAQLVSEQDSISDLDLYEKNGIITFVNNTGTKGKVLIEYDGTVIQKVSNIISLVAFFAVIIICVVCILKKNGKK